MSIVGIVAVSRNLAIGKDGKLPWHYSDDLKFFKRTTLNSAVLMGSSTWKSIGKPLPKRLNVVISRNHSGPENNGAIRISTPEEALLLEGYLNCDLFVIGGSKTYDSFSSVINKWIVTEIPAVIDDADVFMAANFLEGFEESGSEEIGSNLTAVTYERVS